MFHLNRPSQIYTISTLQTEIQIQMIHFLSSSLPSMFMLKCQNVRKILYHDTDIFIIRISSISKQAVQNYVPQAYISIHPGPDYSMSASSPYCLQQSNVSMCVCLGKNISRALLMSDQSQDTVIDHNARYQGTERVKQRKHKLLVTPQCLFPISLSSGTLPSKN